MARSAATTSCGGRSPSRRSRQRRTASTSPAHSTPGAASPKSKRTHRSLLAANGAHVVRKPSPGRAKSRHGLTELNPECVLPVPGRTSHDPELHTDDSERARVDLGPHTSALGMQTFALKRETLNPDRA